MEKEKCYGIAAENSADEKVLVETTRLPLNAQFFFCLMLGGAFLVAAFSEKSVPWKMLLIALSLICFGYCIHYKATLGERVCVTEKRVLYYKASIFNKSAYRTISIPIKLIESVHLLKNSVMFGDKTSGALIIKQKGGKEILLPLLCEGEYIAECIGERLKILGK